MQSSKSARPELQGGPTISESVTLSATTFSSEYLAVRSQGKAVEEMPGT